MIAVIFDLDGVIVDTARFHYLGWKRLADEMGIPFDEKANEKLRGLDRKDSLLAMVGQPLPEEEIARLTERKNSYYCEYLEALSERDLLPGAKELLIDLKKKGIKIALASSSKNARTVLKKIKLEETFDAVVEGHDLNRGKPDPQIFLLAARRLGKNPKECVVVEDAQAGIEAAKRAGMCAIGIGRADTLNDADLVVRGLNRLTVDKLLNLAYYKSR